MAEVEVTVDLRVRYTINDDGVQEAYGVGDVDSLTTADVAKVDGLAGLLVEGAEEIDIVEGSWRISPVYHPGIS
jgi:hypothetical protein